MIRLSFLKWSCSEIRVQIASSSISTGQDLVKFEHVIRIWKVAKSFPGVRALTDVDFDVQQAKNIHLGNEPGKAVLPTVIDEQKQISTTMALFDELNLALDP